MILGLKPVRELEMSEIIKAIDLIEVSLPDEMNPEVPS